jgi:hypothetical protein
MLPQLGVGGGTPTPTKLSAASMKMFDAAYKGRQRGRAKEMWHFSHEVNFAKVAEAMGCVGFRVGAPRRHPAGAREGPPFEQPGRRGGHQRRRRYVPAGMATGVARVSRERHCAST